MVTLLGEYVDPSLFLTESIEKRSVLSKKEERNDVEEKEKDAQIISSMKVEIEALKLELSNKKESNKTKDASIESMKESPLRSLL